MIPEPTPEEILANGLDALAARYNVPVPKVRAQDWMQYMSPEDAALLLKEIEGRIVRELEEKREAASRTGPNGPR